MRDSLIPDNRIAGSQQIEINRVNGIVPLHTQRFCKGGRKLCIDQEAQKLLRCDN